MESDAVERGFADWEIRVRARFQTARSLCGQDGNQGKANSAAEQSHIFTRDRERRKAYQWSVSVEDRTDGGGGAGFAGLWDSEKAAASQERLQLKRQRFSYRRAFTGRSLPKSAFIHG